MPPCPAPRTERRWARPFSRFLLEIPRQLLDVAKNRLPAAQRRLNGVLVLAHPEVLDLFGQDGPVPPRHAHEVVKASVAILERLEQIGLGRIDGTELRGRVVSRTLHVDPHSVSVSGSAFRRLRTLLVPLIDLLSAPQP